MQEVLVFLGVCLGIIVVPGPDFALVVRNTGRGGRPAAIATAAGVMTGNTILACLAVAGLTAVLRTSKTAYTLLAVAGGIYLLYLGATSLLGWWRMRHQPGKQVAAEGAGTPSRLGTSCTQGLICNLSNPKVAVFYLALLPQFQLAGLGGLQNNIALAAIFLGLSAVWYVALCVAAGMWAAFVQRPPVRQFVALASGLVLTALGAAAVVGPLQQ